MLKGGSWTCLEIGCMISLCYHMRVLVEISAGVEVSAICCPATCYLLLTLTELVARRVGKGARNMICIIDRRSTVRAVPTRSSGYGGHAAQERAFAHLR